MTPIEHLFRDDGQAEQHAARFLRAGIRGPRRAVDLLLEDLRDHGPTRLPEILEGGPISSYGSVHLLLVEGGASLEMLLDMKRRCKSHAVEASTISGHLQGMAGYFATGAAAIVHHQKLILSRNHGELVPILLDLAALTARPWSELMLQATLLDDV